MSSSIRDIARLCGVSPATVSLALRGKGRVSAATRENIQRIVAETGYQANPLFARALSLARQPAEDRYRETLAFLLEYPTENGPEFQFQMHAAAEKRAASMGYKLEAFVVSGKPAEQRRLSSVLRNRGIRGVIVIPRLLRNQPRLNLDWNELGAVEIGRTLYQPRNLHRVESADFHRFTEAMHLLKKVGYKRLGMAVEPRQNQHQRGNIYAAYFATQMRQPEKDRIPILGTWGPWAEPTFQRWMQKYRPDVLIYHSPFDIPVWLANLGLESPKDISTFIINAKEPHLTGMVRDYAGLGKSAVEMLSILLESGELGISSRPRIWQVDEYFQPGTTLQRSIAPFLTPDGCIKPGSISVGGVANA